MLQRVRNLFYYLGKPHQVDRRVCFLISAPRSGTTWLKQALNIHPQIYCSENRLFGLYTDTIYDDKASQPRLRITLDKYVDSFLRHYNWENLQVSKEMARREILTSVMEVILEISTDLSAKPIIVDKVTPYINTSDVVTDSIASYFPNAKIIHLIRDGRDVLTSGVFHWLNKNQNGIERDEIASKRRAYFINQEKNIRLPRFFSTRDIEEWALTWTQPINSMSKLRQRMKVLQISYEEMQRDFSSSLIKICNFLGADSTNSAIQKCVEASTFKKMSRGRQAGESDPTAHVRKGVVGDWKNYFTREDGELFHHLAGNYLVDLGYEKDASWLQSLPEKLDLGI